MRVVLAVNAGRDGSCCLSPGDLRHFQCSQDAFGGLSWVASMLSTVC